MIKIDFSKTNGVYTLSDALWLPDNHNLTEADINMLQQERFNAWLAIITAPPIDETVIAVDGVVI